MLSSLLVFAFSISALAAEKPKRLVIIGDSITEGYGVTHDEAYPSLLQKKILHEGKSWEVVNAGVSGSTSASAASRISWQIKQKPDLILLELGANDGLRGLPVKAMEANLTAAIQIAKKNSIPIVLLGMQMPPNYGKVYAKDFAAVFPRLGKRLAIPVIPFFLDKVAGDKLLNQADGIHPNAKGHEIVADNVFKAIQKLL
ncbi:MAG: arylesterase [Bdellovibrionales bacterium]